MKGPELARDTMQPALGGLRLHHVGVVVDDLEAAAAQYTALGFVDGERFSVPEQAIEAIVYVAGEGNYVELISPTDPEGPIARFMGKRGEGMHHVAYLVDDIEATLARLHDAGIRLIDESPRKGTHGWTIAFVHPESTHGVLTELVQVE
ncbi:MAG: methylmalonyl-CoA epimerase [Chloroflexota bacterium]|nr:methylmalonyl-CoA epimerase [Chloroflexota bacterium]